MESRSRTSPEQFAALLEFMESHGDISRPQYGAQARIKADRLWRELGELLNSIGGGVIKPTDKWKKVWTDWKTKTKKKASLIRGEASGTGGGPSRRLTLTASEERVLARLGSAAAATPVARGVTNHIDTAAPRATSSAHTPDTNALRTSHE